MGNSFKVDRDSPHLLGVFAICLAVSFWCGYKFLYGHPEALLGKWSFVFKDTQQAFMFCFVITSVFACAVLKMIIDSKDIITINENGFYDRRFLKETIAWNDIEGFGFVEEKKGMGELRILVLRLRKFSKKNVRFTWFHHVNTPFWSRQAPDVVQFHLNGLETDFAELQSAINTFRYARSHSQDQNTPTTRLFG